MNEVIKSAIDELTTWASTRSNSQLERDLYPVYKHNSRAFENRYLLGHVTAPYSFLNQDDRTIETTIDLRLVVRAFEHYNILYCSFRPETNMPEMLLARLVYTNKFVDVRDGEVIELAKRARAVLHHWRQVLSGPYVSPELRSLEVEREHPPIDPNVAHVDVAFLNARGQFAGGHTPRKRIPLASGVDGYDIQYLTEPPKLR